VGGYRAVGVDVFPEYMSSILYSWSALLEFALSRWVSRSRRTRCMLIYYRHFFFNWFTTWMWNVV